jgi:predicted dehydrogenase
MVSVNRRFMPFLNRAMEWTRAAGHIRHVRSVITRHARREPEFLWATAVHAVDTLRYIAGDVADATLRVLGPAGASAEWYAIDFTFQSNISGRLEILPTAGMLEETYELIGEGFRALVTCPFGAQRGFRCFRDNRLELTEMVSDSTSEDIVNGCYDEASAFIRALTHKETAYPSIAEVYPSVELCLEMAQTAKRISGRQGGREV